jgi:hypothetical protein
MGTRDSVKHIVCKISSDDEAFQDFYGSLAAQFGDHGTVYIPFPIIPPNARMAIPSPTEVLVAIRSSEAFAILHESVCTYFEQQPGGMLSFQSDDRSTRFTGAGPPLLQDLIDALSCDPAEPDRGN